MFTIKLDPIHHVPPVLPPVDKPASCLQKIFSIFCCCLKKNNQGLADEAQTPYDREFSAPKDVYSLYQLTDHSYPKDPHIHI